MIQGTMQIIKYVKNALILAKNVLRKMCNVLHAFKANFMIQQQKLAYLQAHAQLVHMLMIKQIVAQVAVLDANNANLIQNAHYVMQIKDINF